LHAGKPANHSAGGSYSRDFEEALPAEHGGAYETVRLSASALQRAIFLAGRWRARPRCTSWGRTKGDRAQLATSFSHDEREAPEQELPARAKRAATIVPHLKKSLRLLQIGNWLPNPRPTGHGHIKIFN